MRPCGSGKWSTRCPAHDDQKPSLSVAIGKEGQVLLKCHAGCDLGNILTALNLSPAHLFPVQPREQESAKPKKRVVACYDYADAEGKLLYQVVRYQPKSFAQRRPDGRGGWHYNLRGIDPVPYRLPELLAAAGAGALVFVVEGEKDADRLVGLGLRATCNSGGAGKWRPAFGQSLAGAQVVILPDNDEPGRQHARQVADSCVGQAASIRILELPGLPEKGDVSDFLDAGGTLDRLLALVDAAPRYDPDKDAPPEPPPAQGVHFLPVGEFLASIGEPPPMLVEGVLPEKSIVLLSGKPKFGKSLLALDLTDAVCTGRLVWGERSVHRPGPVCYLGMEDGPVEIANRLLARGLRAGDTEHRLHVCAQRVTLGDSRSVEGLRRLVGSIAPVLLIVDTAREALGVRDYSDAAELSDKLRPLREFAREVCTVLLVAHNRKSAAEDAVDEIAGSNAFASSVDGWLSARRKEDIEGRRRLHLDIDGRGGMRGQVVVELDPATLRFEEVRGEALAQERAQQKEADLRDQFDRLVAFVATRDEKRATASQIAEGMGMHYKMAQRLISEALGAGVLFDTGETQKRGGRGRPAPLFTHLDLRTKVHHPQGAEKMSINANTLDEEFDFEEGEDF